MWTTAISYNGSEMAIVWSWSVGVVIVVVNNKQQSNERVSCRVTPDFSSDLSTAIDSLLDDGNLKVTAC